MSQENKAVEVNKVSETKKTSMGLEQNVAGLLCYLLTWVSGIVFLIMEKENKTVRFHAFQSIAVFAPINILMIILNFIPVIGQIINILLWILLVILWIVLMMNAYQGKIIKIPIAGNFAEKNSNPAAK
jgi:uncharacterized membrane protein